ncbi:hypothetical protein HYALB_00013493 [Hymenoscyphus albidus]|uniref:Uncharacterized protein n=1 Tax=Hymenoscyphus albidus TaxID=595503 RepID=A0A9N9LWJ3_9HELO|nr:hypothetical protein HYALB_00013493 [Hymenoscyphus albidus]
MADTSARSLALSRILAQSRPSTFARQGLPAELSEKILRFCLPSVEVDDQGRQTIKGNDYPASLSRQALWVLYQVFQPVMLESDLAHSLDTILAFGVPLKMVSKPLAWAALVVDFWHGPIFDQEYREYAVTTAEFLPGVVSMVNGCNYARPLGVPLRVPGAVCMANIYCVAFDFRIDDVSRGRPGYVNKLFDGIKGLRSLTNSENPPKRLQINFSGINALDEQKISSINPLIQPPRLTTSESTLSAKTAMDKASSLLQTQDYASSMMWLSLAANTTGYHVGHLKAARGMGKMFLACRMLERGRYVANRMLDGQRVPDEEKMRVVVELVYDFPSIQVVENYREAFGLHRLIVKFPNDEHPKELKRDLIEMPINRASAMIDRGSYESLETARMLLSPLPAYRRDNDDKPTLKRQKWCRTKYRTQYLKLFPHVITELMAGADPKAGYLKCISVIEAGLRKFRGHGEVKRYAIRQGWRVCFDLLVERTSREYADDLVASEERLPNALITKPFPRTYLSSFEMAIEEVQETARGKVPAMRKKEMRSLKREADGELEGGWVKFMKPFA